MGAVLSRPAVPTVGVLSTSHSPVLGTICRTDISVVGIPDEIAREYHDQTTGAGVRAFLDAFGAYMGLAATELYGLSKICAREVYMNPQNPMVSVPLPRGMPPLRGRVTTDGWVDWLTGQRTVRFDPHPRVAQGAKLVFKYMTMR